MKSMLTPLLYDLKRCIIRKSTITLLIIFTLLGTGISYLLASFYKQMNPTLGVHLFGFYNTTYCYLNGVVVDTNGEPVNKFQIYVDEVNLSRGTQVSKTIAVFELYENLPLEGEEACKILSQIVRSDSEDASRTSRLQLRIKKDDRDAKYLSLRVMKERYGTIIWITGGLVSASKSIGLIDVPPYISDQFFNSTRDLELIELILSSYTVRKDEVKLIVLYPTILSIAESSLRVEYSLIEKTSIENQNVSIFNNLNYTFLGDVDKGSVKIFTVNPRSLSIIAVKIDAGSWRYFTLISMNPPMEASYIAYMSSSGGIGLYYMFFPILFLYIAYVFIAKPRTSGSLEFLIARPVTRADVYLNRFLAGVLLAFIATGLFLLSLNTSSYFLIGYSLDPHGFTIVYLGLTASLVTMYSLFYFISTSLRGGAYIGVSIIIYLILYIFWDLIVTIALASTGVFFRDLVEAFKIMYLLGYFNPAGIYDFVNIYLLKHYGLSHVQVSMGVSIDLNSLETIINPVAVVMQPIIFTATFISAGYVIFRKTNLSQ